MAVFACEIAMACLFHMNTGVFSQHLSIHMEKCVSVPYTSSVFLSLQMLVTGARRNMVRKSTSSSSTKSTKTPTKTIRSPAPKDDSYKRKPREIGRMENSKIICVYNSKGGTGKTTLSVQLAGTLALWGYRVLLIDADLQENSNEWASSKMLDTPFPAQVVAARGAELRQVLTKAVEEFDFIVIDTPPNIDATEPWSAMLVADICLVPVIPLMGGDMMGASRAKEMIMQAKQKNPSLQSLVIPSRVGAGKVFAAGLAYLTNRIGSSLFPVSPLVIKSRNAYPESQIMGAVVSTSLLRVKKAVEEIDAITDVVLDMLI